MTTIKFITMNGFENEMVVKDLVSVDGRPYMLADEGVHLMTVLSEHETRLNALESVDRTARSTDMA